MKTSDKLKQAKALIDTPDKWTKKAYARDASGRATNPSQPDAVCFCSVGALHKIKCHGSYVSPYMENSIIDFNDSHTHQEVMQAWDKAIQTAIAAGD